MKLKTTVPFSGFYCSIHDQELDAELEQSFSNDQGEPYPSLLQKAFDQVEWSYVHSGYAKLYTEAVAAEFELESLEFETLVSPKYYNFETDRIFAYIDLSQVRKMFDSVPKDALEKRIKEQFTSRSGFISHYPNDLAEWPESLAEWDHNHIGTLLRVYIESRVGDFDQYSEHELLEEDRGNGMINSLLFDNTEGVDRLNKLYNYLRKREERV